jgi:hypothetical protein
MDQMSFGDAEYAAKKRATRREVFLAEKSVTHKPALHEVRFRGLVQSRSIMGES